MQTNPPAVSDALDTVPPEVVYLQFTNPAAYPPLLHSSRMFAQRGWRVLLLGIQPAGAANFLIEEQKNVVCKLLPATRRRAFIKLQFITYFLWVLWHIWRTRPKWLYVSDPLACPAAYWAFRLFGSHVVYHEHDSPQHDSLVRNGFMKVVHRYRNKLIRVASVLVLPNRERLQMLIQTIKPAALPFCVWNCPSVTDVESPKPSASRQEFRIVYAGSISIDRLPLQLLEALARLPEFVQLHVIGYETIAFRGFMSDFLKYADDLGVEGRVKYLGALPRKKTLAAIRDCDLGLALMPSSSEDINMRHMVGASNKPFDYMACGLPMLVTNSPAWEKIYVDAGYGRSCKPECANSVLESLKPFVDHRSTTRAMGHAGQLRILAEWNYESMFDPVMQVMLERTTSNRCSSY